MLLTLFTPTYNRGYTLPALYESICRQMPADCEWVVVDDGSTDETPALLKTWQEEGRVPMQVIRTANGGKHRAINRGTAAARGAWFYIIDSDDRLPQGALARVAKEISYIAGDARYAGVSGTRIDPAGRKIGGGNFPLEAFTSDPVSVRQRLGVRGDLAEVWRTEVLRKHPFPAFDGERFITEGVVWNEIARHYLVRYFPAGIYTCDYLADGLTRNIRRHHRLSPRGSMLAYSRTMRDRRFSPLSRVRAALNYYRYTIGYRGSRRDYPPTWWARLLYPAAYLIYRLDLRAERRAPTTRHDSGGA